MVVDAGERQRRQRSAEGESPSFECEYDEFVAGRDTIPSTGTQRAIDASFVPAVAGRIELSQDEVLPTEPREAIRHTESDVAAREGLLRSADTGLRPATRTGTSGIPPPPAPMQPRGIGVA